MQRLKAAHALLAVFLILGCQTMKPIHTVDYVDLNRFMGDWYVIANIPTFIEKDAYNAIESYRLENDGTVATTFRFNKGSLDGPLKEYHPRGFIRDKESNAVWGMQFIWPFKAEYRIIFLGLWQEGPRFPMRNIPLLQSFCRNKATTSASCKKYRKIWMEKISLIPFLEHYS